jgi:hypothetical protein
MCTRLRAARYLERGRCRVHVPPVFDCSLEAFELNGNVFEGDAAEMLKDDPIPGQ